MTDGGIGRASAILFGCADSVPGHLAVGMDRIEDDGRGPGRRVVRVGNVWPTIARVGRERVAPAAARVLHSNRRESHMSTEQDDVVALLEEQHTQIKDLLQQVETASGDAKRQPFEDLVRLLAVHESAEEQVVHPASRRAKVAGEVIDDRLHEEDEAKHVLAELYELGVTHDQFAGKFRDFAGSVIEHAELEEKEEFAQLRRSLSERDSTRLATAVRVAEAVAPTRPHPQAGESATANVVFGPPLALFDRVRDAVRDWRTKSEE
ncbi:hemerythrin domain-containing protein [Nocardia sp. NPDC051981]|uniref:hemerythrin domain-containing protein n=1 Tax=Nocardia sp. NPDC051981 TaxID=3155417 RepID=UPI00342BD2F9